MYASLLLQSKHFLARGGFPAPRLLSVAALRPFSTASALRQADDEESVPEKFREDRALDIA